MVKKHIHSLYLVTLINMGVHVCHHSLYCKSCFHLLGQYVGTKSVASYDETLISSQDGTSEMFNL